MAKILIKENHRSFWFERLSLISYYSESDFEKRLVNQASALFSGYFVVPFKKTISLNSDPDRKTTPDLVFIKRDYSSWMLIEVELKGHPYDHVKDQVEVMLAPVFNKTEIIKYLLNQSSFVLNPSNFQFDENKLSILVSTVQPQVMVIVDQTHIDWEAKLNKIKVLLCVVQMYKNGNGEEIMRIKGQFPKVITGFVHCKIAKAPANCLEIINEHELLDKLKTGDEIEIYLNDMLTRWSGLRKRDNKLLLKCMGPLFPINPKKDLTLKFDEYKNIYLFENN